MLCFILNSTAQTQIGADIDGTEAGDLSGISLCISRDGNTIAIGSNDSFGQVRVFKLASTVWSQMGADIVGDAHDYSGRSVSMASDGKTIAISSIGNSLNGKESGLVRVYKWSGSEWKQLGNSILGKEANDNSGWSISLSNNGEILAIGSPWGKNNGNMSGHVRIYKWSGSNWTQLGTDIAGDAVSDQSGWSVSISGNG